MFQRLFTTDSTNLSATIIRFTLGLVLFPHGAQKLLGWYGGYGFEGTMHFFTQTVGLPWIIGFLVIIIEFFGALLLILGLGTRPVAVLMVALGIGIVVTSHLSNGFFMNWSGKQAGEGVEYFLLLIGLAVSLLFTGGGRWSVDSKWQTA